MYSKNGSQTVKVWDLFIRFFHWSLALALSLNYFIFDDGEDIHQWIGYGVIALISSRIIWGFMGSYYARFSTFLPSLKSLVPYLKSLFSGKCKRYLSHNPAGTVMVVLLMSWIVVIVATGLMMEELDIFWGVEWVEDVHYYAGKYIWWAVAAHVLGVIFSSIKERENLVYSMITGFKKK